MSSLLWARRRRVVLESKSALDIYRSVGINQDFLGFCGRKFPTIKAGLSLNVRADSRMESVSYMLWLSLLTVNEKQQWISEYGEFMSGLFREQLVNIAFWELSNAIFPNFSQ